MTKREFVKALCENEIFASQKEAEKKIEFFFSLIEKAVIEEGIFIIKNWGKLELVNRKPRLGRNPKTGKKVRVPARNGVKFKPGKAFLAKIN